MLSNDFTQKSISNDCKNYCPICNNSENNTVYHTMEYLYGTKENFDYAECSSCKSIFLLGIPDDLDKYYPSDYHSHSNLLKKRIKDFLISKRTTYHFQKRGFLGKILDTIKPINENQFDWLKVILALPRDIRILDVGCGDGRILAFLSDIGFENLYGCDKFFTLDSKNKRLNKVHFIKKEITELTGTFDVIYLSHVFEHLRNPKEIMQKAFDLLEHNGLLIIDMPVANSYLWKAFYEHWTALDAPRHIVLPSIESLELLAKEYNFKVESKNRLTTAIRIASCELYRNGIIGSEKFKREPQYLKDNHERLTKLAKEITASGQGDDAYLTFRKIEIS